MQQDRRNIVAWITASSANPSEVSLTLKGLLIGAIPAILTISGIANLNLDNATLTSFFDAVVSFVNALLIIVATAMTLWGAIRKVYYAIKPATASN
jgi:hypothetical protein